MLSSLLLLLPLPPKCLVLLWVPLGLLLLHECRHRWECKRAAALLLATSSVITAFAFAPAASRCATWKFESAPPSSCCCCLPWQQAQTALASASLGYVGDPRQAFGQVLHEAGILLQVLQGLHVAPSVCSIRVINASMHRAVSPNTAQDQPVRDPFVSIMLTWGRFVLLCGLFGLSLRFRHQ